MCEQHQIIHGYHWTSNGYHTLVQTSYSLPPSPDDETHPEISSRNKGAKMVVDIFVSKKRDIASRSSWRSSVQCLKISTVTIHYIYSQFHFTTWYKISCEKPASNTSAQCRVKYSFLNLHIGLHSPDKKQHKKYQIIDSKQNPLLSETSKTTLKYLEKCNQMPHLNALTSIQKCTGEVQFQSWKYFQMDTPSNPIQISSLWAKLLCQT